MTRFALVCHPSTPCPVDLTLSVSVNSWQGDESSCVRLDFEATGDVPGLRIPPMVASPGQADGLWKHTCFEAFVANAQGPGYEEFNCAPSGQWAHYHFSGERLRAVPTQRLTAPHITVAVAPDSLRLSACLPLPIVGSPLQWGFTAVMELDDGSLSYWSLHHPKAQPDFHDRGGWTVQWPSSAA